jgi:aminoglycoside phosphotransferase (APT) family kinase protein
VVKDYGVRAAARRREEAALEFLGGRLPVPPLLPRARPQELRMAFVDGLGGDEVSAERQNAASLLTEMGRFLRRLHDLDPSPLFGLLPGKGSTIVHGDFAPYNVLATEDGVLVAVLDWEEAHLGDGILDLAWCEWQFKNRHSNQMWAVRHLLGGYGAGPDSEAREEEVAKRLVELRRSNADQEWER